MTRANMISGCSEVLVTDAGVLGMSSHSRHTVVPRVPECDHEGRCNQYRGNGEQDVAEFKHGGPAFATSARADPSPVKSQRVVPVLAPRAALKLPA
jgi:hypothetical protein